MPKTEMKKLIQLARDKSPEARSRLIENISEFIGPETIGLSETELPIMSDILLALVKSVEAELREQLAITLATSSIPLPEVAILLAHDTADVARPLLMKSPLLDPDSLIEIIQIRTDEHRLAIAHRETLESGVSDALVEYGDEHVLEALLQNAGALLSVHALDYLSAESRRVERYRSPLVARDDLSEEFAHRIYWWVSKVLRQKIINDHGLNETMLDEIFRRATMSAIKGREVRNDVIENAANRVRSMASRDQLTHDFLLQSLRQQRLSVFVAGLAELSKMEFQAVWNIIHDDNDEGLVVLAKAIGMERSDFASMHLLLSVSSDQSSAAPPGELMPVLYLYDAINSEQAKNVLEFWQRDEDAA